MTSFGFGKPKLQSRRTMGFLKTQKSFSLCEVPQSTLPRRLSAPQDCKTQSADDSHPPEGSSPPDKRSERKSFFGNPVAKDSSENICTRGAQNDQVLDLAIKQARPDLARRRSQSPETGAAPNDSGLHGGTSMFYKLLHLLANEHERELEFANCPGNVRKHRHTEVGFGNHDLVSNFEVSKPSSRSSSPPSPKTIPSPPSTRQLSGSSYPQPSPPQSAPTSPPLTVPQLGPSSTASSRPSALRQHRTTMNREAPPKQSKIAPVSEENDGEPDAPAEKNVVIGPSSDDPDVDSSVRSSVSSVECLGSSPPDPTHCSASQESEMSNEACDKGSEELEPVERQQEANNSDSNVSSHPKADNVDNIGKASDHDMDDGCQASNPSFTSSECEDGGGDLARQRQRQKGSASVEFPSIDEEEEEEKWPLNDGRPVLEEEPLESRKIRNAASTDEMSNIISDNVRSVHSMPSLDGDWPAISSNISSSGPSNASPRPRASRMQRGSSMGSHILDALANKRQVNGVGASRYRSQAAPRYSVMATNTMSGTLSGRHNMEASPTNANRPSLIDEPPGIMPMPSGVSSDGLELHDIWHYYLHAEVRPSPSSAFGLTESKSRDYLRRSGSRQDLLWSESTMFWSFCKCLSKMTSNPASKRRLTWDVLGVALLILDLIWVPMQVFELQAAEFTAYLQIITTVFWSLDLFASFFVGYHHKGLVIMDPRKIAIHYLKTWFWLDLSLVSTDVAIFLFDFRSGSHASASLRIGKITRGIRAFKLLRLVKFRAIVGDLLSIVRSEYVRTVISIFKIILFIVAVNHYIACGFFGLHHLSPDQAKTWVTVNFVSAEHESTEYRYFTALHWSLTQFTPASMEVVPVNSIERMYTVLVLLFALVTFSSFVSSITTAMTHLRHINAKKMDQDSKLLKYLSDHSVSPPLTSRVLHFFQERAKQGGGNGTTKEEDVELFQVLPESMKHELRWEAYKPIINWHPLFRALIESDAKTVREICNCLSERQLMVRDELFGHAAQVSHMFFVKSGTLKYEFVVSGLTTCEEIDRGSWACEICLWVSTPVDSNPFVAKAQCELVMLWCDAFMRVIDMNPTFAPQLAVYAQRFTDAAGELSKRCRMQAVLLNNAEESLELVMATIEKDEETFGSSEAAPMEPCNVGRKSEHGRVSRSVTRGRLQSTVAEGSCTRWARLEDWLYSSLWSAHKQPGRKKSRTFLDALPAADSEVEVPKRTSGRRNSEQSE